MILKTSRRQQSAVDWDAEVKRLVELYEHRVGQLQGPWQDMLGYWRLYYADPANSDSRVGDDQQQRANITSPHGYTNTQTMATHLLDMVLSQSPPIQVAGRGDEDTDAAALERLVNYTHMELNPAEDWLEENFTRAAVQGINVLKQSFRADWNELAIRPRPWDDALFREAIVAAEAKTQTRAPLGDPAAFRQWAAMIQAALPGFRLPRAPVPRTLRIPQFVGPWIRNVDPWDLAYDPLQPDAAQQRVMFHREIMRKSDLEALAEDDPETYNAAAIADVSGGGGSTNNSAVEFQNEMLKALGLQSGVREDDPLMRDSVEVIEVSAPGERRGLRWGLIANRTKLITNDPETYPWNHGRQPYSFYYDVPTPGFASGVSIYRPNASLHTYIDAMRSRQLDLANLMVLGPLKRLRGSTDSLDFATAVGLQKIVEVDSMDDLEPLFKLTGEINVAREAVADARYDIDLSSGVDGLTRGQQAQIGRVSATENTMRQTAALARWKARLTRLNKCMRKDIVPVGCSLWQQNGDPEMVQNVAGLDPLRALSSDVLTLGMQQDYVVMTGAVAAEAALLRQQLNDAMKTGADLGVVVPGGKAAFMLFAQALGMLRVRRIPELMQLAQQDVVAAQQMQAAAAQQQQQPPPGAGQPMPQEMGA